jgi:type 1 glutamine amidotransferase
MGELTPLQEKSLCEAVRSGVGLAGAHGGMGDAFRSSMTYNEMVGGRFVSHPYVGPYTVRVVQTGHPLAHDLAESFVYDSEQYYLHVDPGLNVILATDYDLGTGTVEMPVAWTRKWGNGRVFYCALGHSPKEYDECPSVWNFIISGIRWASR